FLAVHPLDEVIPCSEPNCGINDRVNVVDEDVLYPLPPFFVGVGNMFSTACAEVYTPFDPSLFLDLTYRGPPSCTAAYQRGYEAAVTALCPLSRAAGLLSSGTSAFILHCRTCRRHLAYPH